MTSTHFRTAALLLAGLALTAAPSYAQRNNRREGGDRGARQSVERAQPRGRTDSRPTAAAPRQVQPRQVQPSQVQPRQVPQRQVQPRVEQPRAGQLYSAPSNRSNRPAYRYNGPAYRASPNRSYGYGYRPYTRSYVLPYGWRPYGYRPGWNLNLYFGPAYGYGYPGGYGYYSILPGQLYGSLRIVDAPRDAQVFVDGYYAGIVDDYDGVFQHLNLEAGPHHIEVELAGYPPIAFDVQIEPGRTITYHANPY